jgi:DNA-binding ferritin-like protein
MNEQQHIPVLQSLLAHLRAGNLWFHGAHHVTVGAGFQGDHKFYRQVYEQYTSEFDKAAEKAIVAAGVAVAAPALVSSRAAQIVSTMPAVAGLNGHQIAAAALQVERQTQAMIEQVFRTLESAKRLPLGMNNFLSQAADDHDVNVYKLVQRVSGGQG